jgi:hypothetical protein
MSEIRTISQGNYILQGTVATSAGIVGDGTTQNPLRADETVLWENTTSGVYNDTITLNEPWSGFNKIGIEVTDAFGWGGKSEQFDTLNLAGTRAKNFSCSYPFVVAGSPNKQFIRGCQLTFANDEFTSGTVISFETTLTPNTTIACTTGGSGPRLVRIIGINRIGG